MKKDYCDNTSCGGFNKREVHRVEILPEFEGGTAYWCADCIKRDNDMIEKKILCSKCGISLNLDEEQETGLCVQCENNPKA